MGGALAPADSSASERGLRLHQELHRLDVRVAVQWESEIDVEHVAERRSRAEKAQSEADVAEPAGVLCIRVGPAPRPAEVVEHGAAHPEKLERIPVGIPSALDVHHDTVIAALIVAGVATQAGVASDHELGRGGGVPENVAGEIEVEQGVAVGVAIELERAPRRLLVQRTVPCLTGPRNRAEQNS